MLKRMSWMSGLVALTLLVAGCQIKVDSPQIKVNAPSGNGESHTCSVTSGDDAVESGDSVELTVKLGDAVYNVVLHPPFTIEGLEGEFEGNDFKFTKIFTHDGSGEKVFTGEITVKDSRGGSISCPYSVTVKGVEVVPAVTLSASPSATGASIGSSITVSALTSGFSATPAIAFSASTDKVGLAVDGSKVVVTSTDGVARDFAVTAKATHGTETATADIALKFVPSVPITCTLSHTVGDYVVNDEVEFKVTSGNETLSITEFNGKAIVGGGSTGKVKFTSSGSKKVTARAKSASGALCNAGALMEDMLFIWRPLSCTVKTFSYSDYPGWSYEGEWVYAYAEIPQDALIKGDYAEVIEAESDGGYFGGWVGNLGIDIFYDFQGSYPVKMKIQDSAETSVTCSPATHEVLPWYWW